LGSMFPNWWVTGFQYNAFLVVVLVCAAVDGAVRLDRSPLLARWRRGAGRLVRAPRVPGGRAGPGTRAGPVALGCAAVMCAVAVFLVPHFAFRHALHPSYYQRDARMNAAAAAVGAV